MITGVRHIARISTKKLRKIQNCYGNSLRLFHSWGYDFFNIFVYLWTHKITWAYTFVKLSCLIKKEGEKLKSLVLREAMFCEWKYRCSTSVLSCSLFHFFFLLPMSSLLQGKKVWLYSSIDFVNINSASLRTLNHTWKYLLGKKGANKKHS